MITQGVVLPHRANAERPVAAACVLQGGEGALERGRNAQKEEHLQRHQSLFSRSEPHDSHTNRQQACVTDVFNSSVRETAGWPSGSGSREEARGRRPSVKGAGAGPHTLSQHPTGPRSLRLRAGLLSPQTDASGIYSFPAS